MSSPESTVLSKLILIVLYRVKPGDSQTLLSLRESAGMLRADDVVLVWDNSPEAASPEAIATVSEGSPASWMYRSTPENRSLAAIYNEATRLIPGKDLLLIFDHDSHFSSDFFAKLDSASAANPDIDLFVPLIRQGDLIVSPGHFRYFKGSLWKKPGYGRVPSRNTVVIGSGMAIRSRFLETFGGFEERLQLYGIDSNFMLRYAGKNPFFFVMDPRFGHSMEDYRSHDVATLRRRLDAFNYASRINAELFPWPVRLLTEAFLAYKSIKLRLQGSSDRQDGNTEVAE